MRAVRSRAQQLCTALLKVRHGSTAPPCRWSPSSRITGYELGSYESSVYAQHACAFSAGQARNNIMAFISPAAGSPGIFLFFSLLLLFFCYYLGVVFDSAASRIDNNNNSLPRPRPKSEAGEPDSPISQHTYGSQEEEGKGRPVGEGV